MTFINMTWHLIVNVAKNDTCQLTRYSMLVLLLSSGWLGARLHVWVCGAGGAAGARCERERGQRGGMRAVVSRGARQSRLPEWQQLPVPITAKFWCSATERSLPSIACWQASTVLLVCRVLNQLVKILLMVHQNASISLVCATNAKYKPASSVQRMQCSNGV